MLKLKVAAVCSALAFGLSAMPAEASYRWCYAHNTGPDFLEVLISGVFWYDDSGVDWSENNWVSYLDNNGWKYNSDWGCLGPYDTEEDANYSRGDSIRSYENNGYSLFFPDYYG